MQEEFRRQQNELRDRIEPVDKFDMNSVKQIAALTLRTGIRVMKSLRSAALLSSTFILMR